MTEARPLLPRAPYVWLAVLYVASGLPYGLVNRTAPLLYRAEGVDLGKVTNLTLVGLPWVLKFLWAPWVDRLGLARTWVVVSQLAMAGLLLVMAGQPADEVPPAAWLTLVAVAVASATQDAALDGWVVRAVRPADLGPANGVRASAYRIAVFILAGGLLVGVYDDWGWQGTWSAAAATLAVLAVVSWFMPSVARPPASGGRLDEAFRRFRARDGFWALAAFALLFKVGDFAMGPVTKPLLLARGFTTDDIAYVVVPLEVLALVLGATAGGLLTRRWGVFRALWLLGALQALSNLGYAAAEAVGEREAYWAAAMLEQGCAGLGTAPFLALLTLSCEREHASAQYSLLTAFMGVGGILAGTWSGDAVKAVGYAPWFVATFALSIPAFLLLAPVKRWLGDAGRAPPR